MKPIFLSAAAAAFAATALLLAAGSEDALAQELRPRVCLGYQAGGEGWSKQVIEVRERDRDYDHFICPKASAILSVFKQAMRPLEGRYIGIDANCCPLPATDILLDEHVEVETECPENFTATGGHLHRYGDKVVRPLRCTKINTQRYQLGKATPGVFWGAAGSAAFPMQERKRIKLTDIPLGIRHGVTRYTETIPWPGGCIGQQPGQLFAGKQSKRCAGHLFRELQFAGAPGDPARGAPVPIVPQCSAIADIFDPKSECTSDAGLEQFRRQEVE